MNFPKLVVIIAVAAVAIGSFVYFTRVDRSNPAEVAAAFTKAMKKQDTKTAAEFYMPDKAEAWKTAMDAKIDGMKSGTFTSYFENIPADAVFATPANANGTVRMESADKGIILDLTQVETKWYVSKTTL
jgi:hypothetical protein